MFNMNNSNNMNNMNNLNNSNNAVNHLGDKTNIGTGNLSELGIPENSLLEKLMALDFMAVDLQLYLDTHPEDKNAIKMYNETLKEAQVYREQYEKEFAPLYSFRSPAIGGWRWEREPFPWEYEMNLEFNAKFNPNYGKEMA